jgi:hypothetical protein
MHFENLNEMVKFWGQQTFSKLSQKYVENLKIQNNREYLNKYLQYIA